MNPNVNLSCASGKITDLISIGFPQDILLDACNSNKVSNSNCKDFFNYPGDFFANADDRS